MKKLQITRLLLLSLVCLVHLSAFSQNFNEINSYGWGGGLNGPKPTSTDIDNDGRLDFLIGLENGKLDLYEQAEPGSDNLVLVERNFSSIQVYEHAAPAFADLDGDGLIELLVGEFENVFYYEQDAPDSYSFSLVNNSLFSIAEGLLVPVISDLDNDGLLEVLLATDWGGVKCYEQTDQGSTNFNLITNSIGVSVEWGSSFCIEDFDGDDKIDILSGRGGEISHYEQVAPGVILFEQIDYNWLSIDDYFYYAPYITDFDSDGLFDLLIGVEDGNIYHFKQELQPSYNFNLITENLLSSYPESNPVPAVTDVDNDGRRDIFIGNQYGSIDLYEQAAPGVNDYILIEATFENIDVGQDSHPECTDLNGDGLLDLLIGNDDGIIFHYVQETPGSYSFNLVTDSFCDIEIEGDATPKVYDLDRDGLLDLLVGLEYYNDEYIRYEQELQNSLEFVYQPGGINGLNTQPGECMAISDIDQDGALDILLDMTTRLDLFEESLPGNLNFVEKQQYFIYFDYSNPAPYFCDLDGDDKLDLVCGLSSDNLYLYEQGEDSLQFNVVNKNVTNEIDAGYESTPLITDLDSNGVVEAIIGCRSGYLRLYQQDTLNPLHFNLLNDNFCNVGWDPFSYSAPTIADIDGNGLIDLLLGHDYRIARFEQMASDPFVFEKLTDNFLPGASLGDQPKPLFYDINNDGLLELLIGKEEGGLLHYQQVAPFSELFSPVSTNFSNISVGENAAPTICDINNNGLLDLLIGNEAGKVFHYEQVELETLEFELKSPNYGGISAGENACPTVADINFDGYNDILVGKESGGVNLYIQEEQLALVPYSLNLSSCNFPDWWTQEASNGLPFIWTTENTNLAGGNPCEIKASPFDASGTSRLKSPLLDVDGMDSFTFAFKHYFEDAEPGITGKIEWSSDGVVWSDAGWEINSGNGNIGPETEQLEISDFGGNKIYLSFTLIGNHNQFGGWYVDDIWVFDEQAAPSKTNPVKPLHLNLAYNGTELIWDEVPNATGYSLYFGTDNPPTNIENGLTLTDNVYSPQDYLDFASTFYWKVVPYNDYGSPTDCDIWEFTIKQLPPPRNLMADFAMSGVYVEWEEPLTLEESQVWVADLDPNTSSGPTMHSILEELGYTVYYENELPQDPDDYQAIFVCLGIYTENHVLNAGEGQLLADYLNNGGNLYMEGGDTWYFDDQTPVHSMFNIIGVADGSDDVNSIIGLDNTPFFGMDFNYNGENYFIDRITANNQSTLIFENDVPQYGVTVANTSPEDYNTIGSSVEFGGLVDNTFPSTKRNLMINYLETFGLLTPDEVKSKNLLGYNVYRSVDSTGVYTQINDQLITELFFWDEEPLQNGRYYYIAKAIYDEGISVNSDFDFADITLGLDENTGHLVSVFPNPASNLIEIASPVPIRQIIIYNSTGNRVFTHNEKVKSTIIQIENLNTGIYLIELQLDNRTETRKLIIKRE
jgi:DNA-binding PadR family transcriptional regulator